MRERRERRGERGWRGARRGRAAHAPPPPCSNAYNMVINKFGGRLYDGLAASVTAHLTAVAASLATARGEELLRALKTAWDAHCKSMQMIRDILMVGDGEERGEKCGIGMPTVCSGHQKVTNSKMDGVVRSGFK